MVISLFTGTPGQNLKLHTILTKKKALAFFITEPLHERNTPGIGKGKKLVANSGMHEDLEKKVLRTDDGLV